ncbi:endospore germination permease [Clostridium sp. JS66]|uniref:GerAB/ArcD/ProY family transporter n=1 Tax=Clostridium sp. JS66 TaxID=3064705 RepID=UPI00298E7179|nr:endospore germination permease [Clostridium sp. JS66]WPC41680.1 endospore germination permease [Clostridium sp. JS66]
MSKKEIISTNQFIWMLFSIITSFTTLQIPGLLIFHAGRSAWLSTLIAWVLDVLLALVYAYMGIRFPGQNFVQYSITILGKYLGRIVGLMFPLFFLTVTSLLMRAISTLISNTILPKTPMEIVLISGYILIAYAVKKGIEVVARVCEILGPIYLLSFISLFILIAPLLKINRLKPQFDNGFYPIFSGSLFILTFIGICIMMGMYIPVCNQIENGFMAKFIAVSIGVFVICTLVIFAICIFGAEQAGNMVNPGLMLARMIKIGSSIDRVEVIWFIVAIAAGIMTSVNLIWASSLGISQIIGLNTYKSTIYPVTLIAAILSIISFNSNVEVFNFAFYVYPFIGIFVETGLELFLFIMALILKKH